MGNPYAGLGFVDEDRQRQADAAVARLSTGPRRPQRDLLRLGHAWFSVSSCFRLPRRAAPTVAGVRIAAGFVGHPDVQVAVAALSAVRSAALVFDRRAFPDLPSSWADDPEVAEAIARGLTDERVPVRLSAARLLADFPAAALVPPLRERLRDRVYTVRWLAIRALAPFVDHAELGAVLAESRPRAPHQDHDDAVAALAR